MGDPSEITKSLEVLSAIAYLYPDRQTKLNLDDLKKQIFEVTDEILYEDFNEFLRRAQYLKLLFPTEADQLEIDEEDLQLTRELIAEHENPVLRAFTAVEFCIAFPAKKDELGIDIDATVADLQQIIQERRGTQQGSSIADVYWALAVLTADRIEVLPNGQLKTIPKPADFQRPADLPERSLY